MSILEELSSQHLLQSLPPRVLQQLSLQPVIELPSGAQVFDRNNACAGFPVIFSGGVHVFKHLSNGRRIELYRVTPEEPCILSLGCLLGGGRYPASAVTVGTTRIVMMPPNLFSECLATEAAFRNAMFRALGDRLVNAMDLVEEVVSLRLDVRLAATLLLYHAAAPIPMTHQQLADELGTVRETVSRILNDFADQGMLKLGRGQLEIVDAQRLRALANTR